MKKEKNAQRIQMMGRKMSHATRDHVPIESSCGFTDLLTFHDHPWTLVLASVVIRVMYVQFYIVLPYGMPSTLR